MHDRPHIARRSNASLRSRARVMCVAALGLAVAIVAIGSWRAAAADTSGAAAGADNGEATTVLPALSQPNWYYMHEAPAPTPVEVPGLSQPSFITTPTAQTVTMPVAAPAKLQGPTPVVMPQAVTPVGKLNQAQLTQPTQTIQPSQTAASTPQTTPAAAVENTSLWRQFLGKPQAQQPAAAPQIALKNSPPASLPTSPPADSHVVPNGPVIAGWSPQYGDDLVHQALGIMPAPASTLASSSAAANTNNSAASNPTPVNPLGGLMQQMAGTTPTPTYSPARPSAVASPAPAPAPQPPRVATQTNMAGPLAFTIPAIEMPLLPTLPLTAPSATAVTPNGANVANSPAPNRPDPSLAQSPQVPMQRPTGDPVLNKLADTVDNVSQSRVKDDITAGLLQPLAGRPYGTQPSASAANIAANTAQQPSAPATNVESANAPGPSNGLDMSLLTRPFEMTNERATATAARSPANNAPAEAAPKSVWNLPLLRQFAMSSGEDLRKPPAEPAAPSVTPEPKSPDSGWAFTLPTTQGPVAVVDSETGQTSYVDGQLVAFLQAATQPQPEPADLDARTGENSGPDGAAKPGESLAQADKLGTAPEDNTLEFLRTQTVLLKPGDSQCDVGINYLLTENDFPVLLSNGTDIVGVTDARFRVRQLAVPIEYRTGLSERVQGFIGAPIGWSNTQLGFNQFEDFRNDGGLGDINFGLTMQLKEASVDNPYWVGTLSATAPTGGDPFTGVAGLAPSAPSLGQGFWSINGTLLFIQPYDPVIVFYGVGMERFFSHDYIGAEIEPGAQYTYTFGLGFSVNDRVTLSGRFRGTYQEEIEINGQRLIGSNAEPMSLRFSATISKPCERIVEPFVEFGLTDDATDVLFGVTWTFSPNARARAAEKANADKAAKEKAKQ